MNRPWLILVLAGLNVALAGMSYHLLRHPSLTSRQTPDSAPDVVSTSPVHSPAQFRVGPKPSKEDERFSWRRIATGDLKLYIANLRAANCPEETIQDIIIAEVDRLYRGRESALGLVRSALKPWEVTVASGTKDYDRLTQLRHLRLEKLALLKDLLGIDVPVEIPELVSRSSNDSFEAALEYLPPEKRAAAREIQDRYWEVSERLKQKVDGIYLPEDLEEFRRARGERRDAMTQLLTPQEFDDLELRASSTAARMKNQLAAFEPTEAEFRALFASQRQFDDAFSTPGQLAGDHGEFMQRQQEARQQTDQSIRTVLGEARYAEYQRAQDGMYRNIYQAARDTAVPRENMQLAYDTIQNSRKEFGPWAAQLNQTPDLTEQQRIAAVGEYQQRQNDALRQLLGDEAFKKLEGRLPKYNIPRSRPPRTRPQANP